MKNILFKTKGYFLAHKKLSALGLIILVLVSYKAYGYVAGSGSGTRYVETKADKGNVSVLVTGTGQVSALKQVILNAKTSGEVVYVGAKSGDYASAGQVLVQLDARDAKMALDNAKLSLEKAKQLAETSDPTKGLSKNSSDALTTINKYFIDTEEILSGLDDIYNDYTVSVYKMNLQLQADRDRYAVAEASYNKAKKAHEQVLAKYRSSRESLTDSQISVLISEVVASAQQTFQAVKDSNTFVTKVYDGTYAVSRSAELIDDKTNLNTWVQTVDSAIASLSSSRNTITSSNYEIKSLELTVKQKQYAYNDCFVVAPFDGLVQIDVAKGDTISGSVGTIVTNQKVATVELNEVDIAKVKIGQKANLTFDVADDLKLTGTVSEVDVVGAVSQGVVSYKVKINFNTQDERIKPSMSVSADIVVDGKNDVLVVPSEAVKTLGNRKYVETLSQDGTLNKIFIEVGLSDDTNTEIVSGLNEGDKIVTQTINSTTQTKTTNSLLNLMRGSNSSRDNSGSSSNKSSNSSSGRRNNVAGASMHSPF